LFYRDALPGFRYATVLTIPCRIGYPRSSRLGCAPHTDLSADVLRPLSDWLVHLFNRSLATTANAAVLLVSRGHRYSLVLQTHDVHNLLSPAMGVWR
jgi:hypothetical protein